MSLKQSSALLLFSVLGHFMLPHAIPKRHASSCTKHHVLWWFYFWLAHN